jgi:hypothetical protein
MGTLGRYYNIHHLPTQAPVFPLSGGLLLPRARLPLNIFEPRYLVMVDDALAGDRLLALIQPETAGAEASEGRPRLAGVGTVGRITAFSETEDGRYRITVTGICRFRLDWELAENAPYRRIAMDFGPYAGDLRPAKEPVVDREALFGRLVPFLEARRLEVDWDTLEAASGEVLINSLAMMLPLGNREKQGLLLAETVQERARMLLALLEMGQAGGGQSLQ